MEIGESIQPSTSAKISRLGNCEICVINDAKYTCPKCEVKYCSLKCSGIHKKEVECDGVRDRTKFIPINKFSNLDLSNDYRLLEEISRRVETYKKELKRRPTNRQEILPHFLHKLKMSVKKRNTTLKFLPESFIRHKENTTRLNFHKDVIFWRIDWIFPNVENLKLVDHKVRETEKIGCLLQKYFVKQENELLQEKLQYYQALGLSGTKVFLKAEERPGNKYYELDINESLQDNLRKKVIIEYPTIIVVNREHHTCYDMIDSDDEEDDKMAVDVEKVRTATSVVENIVKKAESEDSIYNSLRNLLFVSDSEGEDCNG